MSDVALAVRSMWRSLPPGGVVQLNNVPAYKDGQRIGTAVLSIGVKGSPTLFMSIGEVRGVAAMLGLSGASEWNRAHGPEEVAGWLWEIGRVAYGVDRAWDDIVWFGRS